MKPTIIYTIIALCAIGLPLYFTSSQSFSFPEGVPIFDKPDNSADATNAAAAAADALNNAPVPRIDENTGLPQGVIEQIQVSTSPQYPKPGDQVTISVNAFSFNINKARVTWYQNGNIIADGVGVKQQSVALPNSSAAQDFRLVIKKDTGGTIEKTFTIQPARVELLYEALTYTPPFYKGKRVFSHQSALKVVAVAEFNNGNGRIDPSELVYTWEKNGTVVQEYSGYGQDTLILAGDIIPRPVRITATVSAPGQDIKAREILDINVYQAEVGLYEKNPVLGTIYTQALGQGTYLFDREEVEIEAIPFYFSTDSNNISYGWKLNGRDINAPETDHSMIFRNEDNITGRASIGASVNHGDNIMQRAQQSVDLQIEEIAEEGGVEFSF